MITFDIPVDKNRLRIDAGRLGHVAHDALCSAPAEEMIYRRDTYVSMSMLLLRLFGNPLSPCRNRELSRRTNVIRSTRAANMELFSRGGEKRESDDNFYEGSGEIFNFSRFRLGEKNIYIARSLFQDLEK